VFFLLFISLLFTEPNKVSAQTSSKKLVVHGGPGAWTSPQYLRDNLSWIEANRPYVDGSSVKISAGSGVFRTTLLDYSSVMNQLAPVRDLNSPTLNYNFVLIFNDRPGDLFDDGPWATTAQNWATIARAARDSGLVGIAFDNEEYSGRWSNYPGSADYPEKTLQEYQDQARKRGREIMQAVMAVWPEAIIWTFNGPYYSEMKTLTECRVCTGHGPLNNQLFGPFAVGLMETRGSSATYVDGGSAYWYEQENEFITSYNWRRYGMASTETNCYYIPASFRSTYPSRINISFGLYNDPSSLYGGMTPALLRQVTHYSLKHADSFVWYYVEGDNYLRSGGVSEEWAEALRLGKIDALGGTATPTPTPPTTTPAACRADINGNGRVEIGDLSGILYYWGQSCSQNQASCRADVNSNGRVEIGDIGGALYYWNDTCP